MKQDQKGSIAPRPIRSQAFKRSALAMAISSALMTQVAYAETEKQAELEKIKVEESLTPDTNPNAVPGAPYLADKVSDPRRTRSVAETPQTITVLTATEIEESGRSDLREILDGQPGITLGTGENGNAFGDRYVIRGHEARSDMFVDGLRDPGMTIRESFAVEQIEISKGPSSSFAGRGTTGGAVNSASKRAGTEYDFTKLSSGVGSDDYSRVTVDTNQVINYDTAVRLNLLHAQEDVPDREPAERDRKGAAFSVFHQPTDHLELNADVYHFKGKDKPDLGTYLEDADGDGMRNDPVEDIPVYLQDEDFIESTVDTFTLRAGYELSPKSRIINLARYGTTDNGYVVTGARGTTAYATEADALAETNGYDSVSLSTHQGWQEVEYFANQLNFISDLELGGKKHELVIGTEFSRQKVLNGVYELTTNGASNCYTSGRRGVGEAYCITDASGNTVGGVNSLTQRNVQKGDWDADWKLNTTSLYAMDTVDLTERWTVFGGLRYDYYDYELKTQSSGVVTEYDYTDGDWNGHVGVSFDVANNANVYASFSTATNLNGGESDVGTNGGYGGFIDAGDADVEPEKTDSWELGTKWRLNNGKLLASAAVFRITKDDVMESQRGGYDSTGTANTGKNQVDGIELGIAGNVTKKVSVQAGVAVMNAKVLDSYNEDNIDKTLANFADKSASLLVKYQATQKFAIGGAATYESERYTGQPDSAANETMAVPDYTVYDAFAIYKFNRDLNLRVNVSNLTDENYYLTAYRSGAFTYKGDGRSVNLTLNYNF